MIPVVLLGIVAVFLNLCLIFSIKVRVMKLCNLDNVVLLFKLRFYDQVDNTAVIAGINAKILER